MSITRDTPAGICWTIRSFKVREWRNGGWVSQTWVVCELPPCHVPEEEDGIIRDITGHRRRGSFFAWTSSGTTHRWRYRQYRSQSVFNNLCRIVSMSLLYRCFTHVLPWAMDRRETYLWFQAVKAKLLPPLNIPLSCRDVDGWSDVSLSRTWGFQGTGPNFFTIIATRSNSSSISRGKWHSGSTQVEISTSQWATERLLVMSFLERVWQQCATRRKPTHRS